MELADYLLSLFAASERERERARAPRNRRFRFVARRLHHLLLHHQGV